MPDQVSIEPSGLVPQTALMVGPNEIDAFIAKWRDTGGSELAEAEPKTVMINAPYPYLSAPHRIPPAGKRGVSAA